MELKTLRYFLAVAESQSITKAAESLYITQPALSRQMAMLENELGVELYERGSHSISLTESGRQLKERAQKIIAQADSIPQLLNPGEGEVSGQVSVGAGESFASEWIALAAARVHERYPKVTYHVRSGNANDLLTRLDDGSLEFCLIVQPVDISGYNSARVPMLDTWGLIMRRDNPLAQRETVTPADLAGEPLIFSEQNTGASFLNQSFLDWFGADFDDLNIVATYNLAYNATLLAAAGIGSMVALTKQIRAEQAGDLVFRPFDPPLQVECHLVWKKSRALSPAAEAFLEAFQALD